jgi:hypothetical protein
MRRNRTITVILVLLCLLAALAGGIVLWRHYLPTAGSSNALFEKYKDNPHIDVCLLRDFQVNDTLRVDVITLQALDSMGWETMRKDFNIKPIPSFIQESIDKGEDLMSVQLTPKDYPGQSMDTSDILHNNVMAVSQLYKTISIFEINSKQEIEAICISKYQLE